ncbi:MAG: hypothetical protein HYY17_02170 [Planctomycetes bacterium]|nr:hypothetical protein [Planctomycetota bacterium]
MNGSRSRRVAAQRGISSIVVVALALVTIVLAFVAVLLFADVVAKERTAKALEKRLENLHADQARITKARKGSLAPTGFTQAAPATTPEGGEVSEAPPAEHLPVDAAKSYLKDRREKLLEKPTQQDPGRDPALASNLQDFDKKYADLARNATGERAFNTLEELVGIAATRVIVAMNLADQRRVEEELAEERKNAAAENKNNLPTSAVEYNAELEGKIAEVTKAKNDIDTHSKDRVAGLEKEIAETRKKIETLKIDYNKETISFSNRVNKLRAELEELKVKEVIRLEISEAHGKLLSPDIPNRVAFIDRGSRERIVPGLKFLVARKGAQGRFEYKGKVLVKKVWMTYAEVAITEIVDPKVPLVDGDLIVNPLFHPRRPVVVHFLGEKDAGRLRPSWTTAEAGRRIAEIGSEVRERLTLDVDFVIFTWSKAAAAKEDEEYKRAVLLGIPIEEASEVYRFLED